MRHVGELRAILPAGTLYGQYAPTFVGTSAGKQEVVEQRSWV